MKKFALFLLVPLISLRAEEGTQRRELMEDGALALYSSFDEGHDAEMSRGERAGRLAGESRQVPGVVGQALSFRSEEPKVGSVAYGVKESFSPERGTLMYWFRPGWDGADPEGKYTLAWVTMDKSQRYFAMHRSLSKDPHALFVNFQWDNVLNISTKKYLHADAWVHLAVTWNQDSGQYALYMNGQLVADAPWKVLPEEGQYRPLTLMLGRFYKTDAPINADYDELFLFQRALSPAEIHAYVEETTPGEAAR